MRSDWYKHTVHLSINLAEFILIRICVCEHNVFFYS